MADRWRTDDYQMTELHKQLHSLIMELGKLMEEAKGDVERIKDCTMLEEWRHGCGYSFDDGDMDNDLWKGTYDHFEEQSRSEDRSEFFSYVYRVGLIGLPLETKYPLIAKIYREDVEYLTKEE